MGKKLEKLEKMEKVKVKFLSLLADLTGKQKLTLTIDKEATIKDVIFRLYNAIEDNSKKMMFKSPTSLNRFILIGLNGKDIRTLDNLNTKLKDGDELSFLPAIAGG